MRKIYQILLIVLGIIIGYKAFVQRKILEYKSSADKFNTLFLMMCRWVEKKQRGERFSAYFEKKGYRNIAVYGMSNVGIFLIEELKNTGIIVKYGIDKNAHALYSSVEMYTPEEDVLPCVDVIVVTSIAYFDDVKRMLTAKMKCPIISLSDVVNSMY